MHQLQRELEALKTCRVQEVPATTGEDRLPLQSQEPLVRAVPMLEGGLQGGGASSALLGPCLCGKGAQLPRALETLGHLCGSTYVVCVRMCQSITKSQ